MAQETLLLLGDTMGMTPAEHAKKLEILHILERHEKAHPEMVGTRDVQELSAKVAQAFLAEDYPAFLDESRKLARIYKGTVKNDDEGWEH